MTGLDKIIDKINRDNKEKSNAILENAQKKCDEIIAAAEENGRKLAEKIEADAQKESENIASMARSGAEQIERRAILEAKVEAINETLNKLLSALHALPDEQYFDVLIKLAEKNASSGECVAKLCAKDIARMPKDFETRLKTALASKNAVCTFSKEAADIDGGLILVYGDIEINCSFKAIIEADADIYKAKISEIIF